MPLTTLPLYSLLSKQVSVSYNEHEWLKQQSNDAQLSLTPTLTLQVFFGYGSSAAGQSRHPPG